MDMVSRQFNYAQGKPMQTKKRRLECMFWAGKEKAKPPLLTAESPASAVSSKHTASKPFSDHLNVIWKYSNMWLYREL